MKGSCLAIAVVALFLGANSRASAQMGMDIFKKPTIAKVFNPVVGKGAEYQSTNTGSTDSKSRTMEVYVVGKESVDGKEGYWMEFVTFDDKNQQVVGKTLFTRDDIQFHRMIVQVPGQPAMEMPFRPDAAHQSRMQDNLSEWHSVGTESITVPAGTFSCEHWHNDKNGGEAWTSNKVTPFGMVKETSQHNTMILTKQLADAQDRITGPVKQFDPQAFREQMMQQMQQQHPQKP
jgi:hypothetical protein